MDGEETLAKIAEREVDYGVGRRGECDVSVRYLFIQLRDGVRETGGLNEGPKFLISVRSPWNQPLTLSNLRVQA